MKHVRAGQGPSPNNEPIDGNMTTTSTANTRYLIATALTVASIGIVACSSTGESTTVNPTPNEGASDAGDTNELDAGDLGAGEKRDGAAPGDEAGTFKRVFVTRGTFTGVKFGIESASDGPTAADQRCQGAADKAGLGGKWVAWLSTKSGGTVVNAIDRIPDVGPWKNVKGTFVAFASKAAIADGPGYNLATSDEYGSAIDPLPDTNLKLYVWTGTTDKLAAGNDDCGGWTDGNKFGTSGNPFYQWTQSDFPPCLTQGHLYCFEK